MDYVVRFNATALEAQDLNEYVTLLAMKKRL